MDTVGIACKENIKEGNMSGERNEPSGALLGERKALLEPTRRPYLHCDWLGWGGRPA